MNKLIPLLFIALITFGSCEKEPSIIECGTMILCPDYDRFKVLDYSGLDGCGWVVEDDNGDISQVSNLDTHYPSLIDGQYIWIKYEVLPLCFNICMAGGTIAITDACTDDNPTTLPATQETP